MKQCELSERLAFAKEHHYTEFAKHYGLTDSGAYFFYVRNGVKRCRKFKGLNGHTVEEVADFAKDKRVSEIAEKFGASCSTVVCFLRNHSIPYSHAKGRRKEHAERDDMIRYLAEKYQYATIGRVFGYTREYIRQICMQEDAE